MLIFQAPTSHLISSHLIRNQNKNHPRSIQISHNIHINIVQTLHPFTQTLNEPSNIQPSTNAFHLCNQT
ncbi:hypothetical protein DID88_008837 [Monilinia fructigena]|uniref:Uncharacterized protein n=1 Tax=Monilinia fructigena TaxID=38457 RepID=A0A395J6J4_9HELO|nr:hypothetical protein DID88_008837 [Monilinia fructigena]